MISLLGKMPEPKLPSGFAVLKQPFLRPLRHIFHAPCLFLISRKPPLDYFRNCTCKKQNNYRYENVEE